MKVLIDIVEDDGIRFWAQGGTAEYKGEKIILRNDLGCGVNIEYKNKTYRITPEAMIACIVDVVDGTTDGE